MGFVGAMVNHKAFYRYFIDSILKKQYKQNQLSQKQREDDVDELEVLFNIYSTKNFSQLLGRILQLPNFS